MRPLIILCLCLIGTMSVYAAPEPGAPATIQSLKRFADDPEALVDAARRFHLQQQDLSNWDYALAQEKAENGDLSFQESRNEQIRKRTKNMQAAWEYVLSRYPNNPRALNYFGEFWYDFGGDSNKAVTYWKRSAALDQTSGFADNNLGIYYFHTGSYRSGISHLQKAMDKDPVNPDFLYNTAQMYLSYFPQLEEILKTDRKNLFREAMEFSRKAAIYALDDVDIVQDYAVNFFASVNFDVEVDWRKAAAAWVDARKLVHDDDKIFYTLLNEGRCWTRHGDNPRALELYEQALKLRPTSIIAKELVEKSKPAPANQ